MPSPSTVNMQPVYFPYCKYQSFVGVVRLPERSNTIDLLGLAALLVRQQISVAFEAIPHEGRVVGCANEVRVRLAGRLPVLVAHDARLTQSKQTSETLLRQAVLPSNALDVLSRQILRHESSYQSFDW